MFCISNLTDLHTFILYSRNIFGHDEFWFITSVCLTKRYGSACLLCTFSIIMSYVCLSSTSKQLLSASFVPWIRGFLANVWLSLHSGRAVSSVETQAMSRHQHRTQKTSAPRVHHLLMMARPFSQKSTGD